MLAREIWRKIHCETKSFQYVCDQRYEYAVQVRSPCTEKPERLQGFSARTDLDQALDEVIH